MAGVRRARRHPFRALFLLFALVAMATVVSSSRATPSDPNVTALSNGIESFATRLSSATDSLGAYGSLAQNLPLGDLAPGSPDALDLSNALKNSLNPALDDTGYASIEDLESALDAINTTVGGVTVDVGTPTHTTSTTLTDLTVPITLTRNVNQPLDFAAGIASIQGGVFALGLTATTSLKFRVDSSLVATAPDDAFSIVTTPAPTMNVCANANVAIASFTASLGFTDITVSTDGNATLHACSRVTLTDPDSSGALTKDEFTAHALSEYASATLVDGDAGNDLHAKFNLDASLISGTPDATIEFTDADLSANPPPTVATDFGSLADFANITPGDVAQGLANFAASLSGAQTKGNGPLPFLEEGLSKVFDAAGPLVKYVKRITDADVVCGTKEGEADSDLPTGSTAHLHTGDHVFCRARTNLTVATPVTWVSPNASEDDNASSVSDADTVDTVGATPSKNAEFTMTSDDTFDVTLTFVDNATSQTVTAVPKPLTASDLFAKLTAAAGFDSTPSNLGYDAATKALTFRLLKNNFNPDAVTMGVDFGDKLRNITNLTGLQSMLAAHAGATLDAGDLDLDVTFGVLLVKNTADITPLRGTADAGTTATSLVDNDVDLTSAKAGQTLRNTTDDAECTITTVALHTLTCAAPGASFGASDAYEVDGGLIDRFFVKTNPAAGQHEFSLDALTATVNVSLKGTVGFLEVTAQGDASENTADPSDAFHLAKADATKPVVAVDIKTPDGPIAVDTDPGAGTTLHNVTDSIGLADLLFHLDAAHLDATCNLEMSAGLAVTASVGGNANFAKGGASVDWPTVFKPNSCEPDFSTLEVDADTDFESNLKNFDPFPSLSGVHDGGDGDTNLHDTTKDFTDNSASGENYLNLTLRNKTTGASCTITTVDAHDLNCSLSGGTRPGDTANANKWKDGDEYSVEGNPLALLGIIIDHLDELIDNIDTIDPGLTDKQIPLINKSTKEIVDKIRGLKATLDDLRGFPLGTIKCFRDAGGTNPDLQDLPDSATVYCKAITTITPTTVQWGGKRIDDGVGGFAAGTFTPSSNGNNTDTVGPSPTALVAIPISDGDSTDNTLLGEWRVNVAFEDGAGTHTAEFPVVSPPGSLQKLEELIESKLGISDPNVFKLDLLDLPKPGDPAITSGDADNQSVLDNELHDSSANFTNGSDDPEVGRLLINKTDNRHCTITVVEQETLKCAAGSAMSWDNNDDYEVVGDGTKDLVVHLGTGVCASADVPTTSDIQCKTTDRPAARLDVPLNLDLGGAVGDLVSLSTSGELQLQYAARANLDLGIPLKLKVPDIRVLDTTGAEIEGRVVADGFGLDASIGPIGVAIGTHVTDTDTDPDTVTPGVGVARVGAKLTFKKSGGDTVDDNKTYSVGDFFGSLGSSDVTFAGVNQECDEPAGGSVEESGDACAVFSIAITPQSPLTTNSTPVKVHCTANPFSCSATTGGLAGLLSGKPLDYNLLIQILPRLLAEVQQRLDGASQNIHLPVIGDALDAGADVVGKFNNNVVTPFANIAAQITAATDADGDGTTEPNEIADKVRHFIWDGAGTSFQGLGNGTGGANLILDTNGSNSVSIDDVIVTALCTDSLTPCEDGHSLANIKDFRVTFKLGQTLLDTNTPFDIGLKGVPLRLTGGVASHVDWHVLVDFGLSKADGAYMGTAGEVTIPDDGTNTKANRPPDVPADPDPDGDPDTDDATPAVWNDVKYLQDDDSPNFNTTVEVGMWLQNTTTGQGCRITQIVTAHKLSCDFKESTDEEGVVWHETESSADAYAIIARHDGTTPEVGFDAHVGLGSSPSSCTTDPDTDGRAYLTGFSTDRCMRGEIAFLAVTVRDKESGDDCTNAAGLASGEDPTVLCLNASIDFAKKTAGDRVTFGDLTSGNITISPHFGVTANVDLRFRTGFRADENAGFPSVLGKFHLFWAFNITTAGPAATGLAISFDGLNLDAGQFITKFLEPITSSVRNVTKPLMPVIQFLQSPIPVISDLSEAVGQGKVTMLDVLEAVSGNDLSLLRSLIQFVQFANTLPSNTNLLIELGNSPGSFDVNPTRATGPPPTPDSNDQGIQNATAKKNITNDLSTYGSTTAPADDRPGTFGVAGLTFPFLSDAKQIFGVLLGQDVTLVRYDAGVLRAQAGFGYSFPPIMAGPIPVVISIGGSVEVRGRFAIGYDTSGLRKVLEGGTGEHLLDGIFIDDLDAQGNDVPEVQFIGTVYAEGAASIAIISVGVRGELIFTTNLNLDDRPVADGKLHIEEIVSKLSNPICLFVVSGSLDVSLQAFVEIDLFFFTKRFTIEIIRLTLLKFEVKCEPPVPDLATPVNTDGDSKSEKLIINTGPRASNRHIRTDEINEKFTVRQMEAYTTGPHAGTTRFTIAAFGISEDEFLDTTDVNAGTAIVVTGDITTGPSADDGNDSYSFLEGGEGGGGGSSTTSTPVPFKPKVIVWAGDGNDEITTGDGNDEIRGGPGNDKISAGKGVDDIRGGREDDSIDAGEGNDTQVFGEDGNDTISGGPGSDTVDGGNGDDNIGGAGGAAGEDGGDTLIGGNGNDTLAGVAGNDTVYGDSVITCTADPADPNGTGDNVDSLDGGDGDDTLIGGPENDQIAGKAGNDTLCGNGGRDEITGEDGKDTARGGQGDDDIIGGRDNTVGADVLPTNGDQLFGDGGRDYIVGDEGTLVRDQDTNAVAVGLTGSFFGNDLIEGGAHNDFLYGQAGLDRMKGGTGNDFMRGSTDNDTMQGDGNTDEMYGDEGNDTMYGSDDQPQALDQDNAAKIVGDDTGDTMRGGIGTDLMFGDEGNDTMYGDNEVDTMYGGRGDDVVRGGTGDDLLEGNANDTAALPADSNPTDGTSDGDVIFGDGGQDNITGGSHVDDADADGGDTIVGNADQDVILGDNGDVSFTAGTQVDGTRNRTVDLETPSSGGGDNIRGSEANDDVYAGGGADLVHGDAGDDYVEGNDGGDTAYGDAGQDDIVGGTSPFAEDGAATGGGVSDVGQDNLYGGDGSSGLSADFDVITGDNATINRSANGANTDFKRNTFAASGGACIANDVVLRTVLIYDVATTSFTPTLGTSDGDHIYGEAGHDIVYAGGGDDVVHGGNGDDVVFGNDGVDTITGDGCQDDLVGGTGRTDSSSATSAVNGRLDKGDIISGGDGSGGIAPGNDYDVIVGDNARIIRTTNGANENDGLWQANSFNNAVDRTVTLLDVDTVSQSAGAGTSGNDLLKGEKDDDTAYGQGGNDGISGGGGQDFLQGNANGSGDAPKPQVGDPNFAGDLIHGDDAADDINGGTGRIWQLDGTGLPVQDPVNGTDGRTDGGDRVYGDGGADFVAGDNAVVERPLDAGAWISDNWRSPDATGIIRRITRENDVATVGNLPPLTNGTSGGDTINGGDDGANTDDGPDTVYGQGGDDVIDGDLSDDHVEGNAGDDAISGDTGQDDLIGGTGRTRSNHPTTAIDGRIDDSDPADANDTIHGNGAEDVILGDNGTADRVMQNPADTFYIGNNWTLDSPRSGDVENVARRVTVELDVATVANTAPVTDKTSGADTITGDDGFDTAYGQGGDDAIHGNNGDDHVEGNAGDDTVFGDANQDDLIGGTGRTASNDLSTAADSRLDNVDGDPDGDTLNGGDGAGGVASGDFDTIAGDNATIDRTLGTSPTLTTLPSNGAWLATTWDAPDVKRAVKLYDISVSGATPVNPDAQTRGNDTLNGEASNDVLFGQGGADTITGDDADGDGADASDQPANAGDDYVEGNAGADVIRGNLGQDDIAGGSSSNDRAAGTALDANRDGRLDDTRNAEDLRDTIDTITGDSGDATVGDGDVIVGDNARIQRVLDGAGAWKQDTQRGVPQRDVQLFDIQKVGGLVNGPAGAPADVSGSDVVDANGGRDIVFGQGSGSAADVFGSEGATAAINCQNMGADGPGSGAPFSPTGDDDNDDLPDLNDPDCRNATATGDRIQGQNGQDYLEGNQGSDFVTGGEAEDDITGGSSSNDGHINAIRTKLERSGAIPPPVDLLDGHDQLEGNGREDTIAGDNAFIDRYLGGATGTWITISGPGRPADPEVTVTHPEEPQYGPYPGQTRREVTMAQSPEQAGAWGDDYIRGGTENDDLYGQLGNDWVEGNEGEDAIVGDLGKIVDNLLAIPSGDHLSDGTPLAAHPGDELADPALNQFIRPNQPFLDDTINQGGVLKREVVLYAFDISKPNPGVGHDVALGGSGNDWIHTGPGEDLANGNSGDDQIFLGDNNAGAIVKLNPQKIAHDKVDAGWGGQGHDHIYGGYGADYLDVRPRTTTTAPGIVPGDDPATWFQVAGQVTATPGQTGDVYGDFSGIDFIYGGWDQDAMQANRGDNGPKAGDRLMDWSGSYNIYYLCPATYGDWVTTRSIAPGLIDFLQQMSGGDGSNLPATSTSSGFRDTAIVFSNEAKFNTNPVHPDTPGHFNTACDP